MTKKTNPHLPFDFSLLCAEVGISFKEEEEGESWTRSGDEFLFDENDPRSPEFDGDFQGESSHPY